MLDFVRRHVPGGIKKPLKKLLGIPATRLHRDWQILSTIGPKEEPHLILDIGGHTGWFFHCWLDWCPRAQVYAFEPYPPSFEAMRLNYGADPRVHLIQSAVGDTVGTQTLNVLEQSLVSNSLLTPRRARWDEVRYLTGAVSRIDVSVTTIDCCLAAHTIKNIYLLKIDVQGYEMHVLRGAETTLSHCDHIFIESAVRPLYEGAPRFSDVFEYLTARGFHLMAMQSWHRGNNVLIESDMLFRRNELMPPVDQSIVRAMERVEMIR